MGNLRAVNETYQLAYNSMPRPTYVSLRIQPRTSDSDEPYNQLPAGEHPFISIYGDRLKLAGDSPEVGLTLRSVETGDEHFYPAADMLVNSGQRLCFVPSLSGQASGKPSSAPSSPLLITSIKSPGMVRLPSP